MKQCETKLDNKLKMFSARYEFSRAAKYIPSLLFGGAGARFHYMKFAAVFFLF